MMDDGNYESMVDDVLHKLHIKTKEKGYMYAKDIIILLHNRYRNNMRDAMKIVASDYGVSYKTIESAIRRCIKKGIINCSSQAKIDVFGYDICANNKCSRNYYTVSEFIIYIMNYLHKLEKTYTG